MYSREVRIASYDPELAQAIAAECQRQEDHVELIASENYASPAVLLTMVLRVVTVVLAAMAAFGALPFVAIIVARKAVLLALTLGHFALRLAQHSGIMLGMLKKALLRDAVVRELGIAGQGQIFLDDLLGRAAHLALGARGIEDTVYDIAKRALAVRLVTRTGFG